MPGILRTGLKDVLIFKHSESELFNTFSKNIKDSVSEKFDIVTYFGYFSWRTKMYSFERAWITLPDTVGRIEDQERVVEFGGINFLPDVDNNLIGEKVESSIICVTNNTIRKNLHVLLLALLKVNRRFYVRLIIQETGVGYIASKYDIYLKKLVASLECKHALEVHWINKDNLLPRNKIFEMISSSELLVLPSFVEGAARVVGEAHLFGTNVVLNSNMKGSTNFSLMTQDYEYKDTNDLASYLYEFRFKKYSSNQINMIRNAYLASMNKEKFFNELEVVLSIKNGALASYNQHIDMVNFLSCHQMNLPREVTDRSNTDEITSLDTMFLFVELIVGRQSTIDLRRAKRYLKYNKIASIKRKLKNLVMYLS